MVNFSARWNGFDPSLLLSGAQPLTTDKVVLLGTNIVVPFCRPELETMLKMAIARLMVCPKCESVISERAAVQPLPNTLLFFI